MHASLFGEREEETKQKREKNNRERAGEGGEGERARGRGKETAQPKKLWNHDAFVNIIAKPKEHTTKNTNKQK